MAGSNPAKNAGQEPSREPPGPDRGSTEARKGAAGLDEHEQPWVLGGGRRGDPAAGDAAAAAGWRAVGVGRGSWRTQQRGNNGRLLRLAFSAARKGRSKILVAAGGAAEHS